MFLHSKDDFHAQIVQMPWNVTKSLPRWQSFLSSMLVSTCYEVVCVADIRVVGLLAYVREQANHADISDRWNNFINAKNHAGKKISASKVPKVLLRTVN